MSDETRPPPSLWQAVKRGVMCRCPNCGQGNLFAGYLEQVEVCSVCGTSLSRFNAGLVLPLVVGLLVVFLFAGIFLIIELNGGASPGTYLAVMLPTSAIASLLLIRPCKGAVVGLMWATGTSDELNR